MIKRIAFTFVLWTYIVYAGTIKVAVAANVSYAIKDLVKAFNVAYPETKVQVILGSSGKLTAQVKHSAPYALLLSADMKYPEALYAEGFAVTKPVVYAQGALALLSQKERNYCTDIHVLESLDIEKIAIANPKTAPYGIVAKEALVNAKLYEKLKEKFVYGESISQTVAYATTAADIGIIAKSSLFSPVMAQYKEGRHWQELNASLYVPISQGMVILKEGKDNDEVKAFYDFMLSFEAKKILVSYGYTVQ
jgi:molybdate transport system substrate-binding protein